jgi:thiol-disulfide isomerase/thioredoxin
MPILSGIMNLEHSAHGRQGTCEKRGVRLATLAGFLLALGGCSYEPPPQPFNSSVSDLAHDAAQGVGAPAAELHGPVLSGAGPSTLAAAHGKVVIVDFWASWCLPCARSVRDYERLKAAYPDDLAIITVNVDGAEAVERGDVADFVRRTGSTLPVVWDKDGSLLAAYKAKTIPTAFVVGRDGFVRSIHTGFEDREDLRIESVVRLMLGK